MIIAAFPNSAFIASGHGFQERQPDAMLPKYELDDPGRLDAHDYACSHRLLKDFDLAECFHEPYDNWTV